MRPIERHRQTAGWRPHVERRALYLPNPDEICALHLREPIASSGGGLAMARAPSVLFRAGRDGSRRRVRP